MATQLKKVVAPSGGDYTSLEACMNANEKNLVTSDEYFDVEISGSWASPDTTACTIHNYTTDSTRYINIYTTGTALHDGTAYASNAYVLYITTSEYAGGNCIHVSTVNNITITGLITHRDGARGANYIAGINTSDCSNILIDNCISYFTSSPGRYGAGGSGISMGSSIGGSPTNNMRNCQAFGWKTSNGIKASGLSISCESFRSVNGKMYNCTAYNNDYNIRGFEGSSGGATFDFRNNAGFGGIVADIDVAGTTVTEDYNASSDTTATGANSLINLTTTDELTSVTSGSEDFHLLSTSNLIGAGVDLSGTFTTDIDGNTRSSWDIGADEYVAVASAVTTGIMTPRTGWWGDI